MAKFFCFNKCLDHYQITKKEYQLRVIENLEEGQYGLHMGAGCQFFEWILLFYHNEIYGHLKKVWYGDFFSFCNMMRQIHCKCIENKENTLWNNRSDPYGIPRNGPRVPKVSKTAFLLLVTMATVWLCILHISKNFVLQKEQLRRAV